MFCSHLHFSLISELSELPDPFSRSRLNGLLQQTKKTADASEADQDRQNQQLQTLTVSEEVVDTHQMSLDRLLL